MFEIGIYHDQETGRARWAVLHCKSYTWYFARRYGRRAAASLARRLNLDAGKA